MEKRKKVDRRQDHLFVSDDRRTGPYDRRSPALGREEIEAEREKVERIRAFKAKDRSTPSAQPLFTPKRLVFLGLALLLLVAILFFLN